MSVRSAIPALGPSSFRHPMLFILLAQLALTVPLCLVLNVWTDEAFSLATTSQGFVASGERALAFEGQPPLYFMLLWLWRALNESVWFARLMSVLMVAASVVLVWQVSARIAPHRSPAWLTTIYALHPMTIYAALEIRTYAFVLLLTAAYMVLFWDRYIADTRTKRPTRLFLIFVAIAGIYSQYFFAFLLAALGTWLIARREWRKLADNLTIGLVTVLGLIPLAFSLPAQLAAHKGAHEESIGIVLAVRAAVWNVSDFLLPIPEGDAWFAAKQYLVRAIYLALVVWFFVGVRKLFDRNRLFVLCAFGGTLAHFAAVEFLLPQHALAGRHAIVLLIPTLLLLWFAAASSRHAWLVGLVTSLSLAISLVTLYTRYEPLAKQGDWKRVAAVLDEKADADETIYVFRPPASIELGTHYHGSARLRPLPRAPRFDVWDQTEYTLKDRTQLMELFAADGVQPGDRVWLAVDEVRSGVGEVEFGHDVLTAAVKSCFDEIESWQFYRSSLHYLRAGDCLSQGTDQEITAEKPSSGPE